MIVWTKKKIKDTSCCNAETRKRKLDMLDGLIYNFGRIYLKISFALSFFFCICAAILNIPFFYRPSSSTGEIIPKSWDWTQCETDDNKTGRIGNSDSKITNKNKIGSILNINLWTTSRINKLRTTLLPFLM